MAYSGDPILAEDLLFRPEHSLIDQSLHSHLGATTTNGDGFGVGWYATAPQPGLFLSTEPAWNDRNLRELSAQTTAGAVSARETGGLRVSGSAPVTSGRARSGLLHHGSGRSKTLVYEWHRRYRLALQRHN
jgi:glutamine amidotransferase